MTGPGTNSYLVGGTEIVALDPGPESDAHVTALIEAASERGAPIRAVLVTHTHPDHFPAAAALGERAGAPLVGFAERDGFVPDVVLADGESIRAGEVLLTALHTPGHASDHLCFVADLPAGEPAGGGAAAGLRILFSGDHIMGGSTVVIAPPDGDMSLYLSSLDRLAGLDPPLDVIAPGHGPLLGAPLEVIAGYKSHRLERELAVLSALERRGRAGVDELVGDVYVDVPLSLHPIARYSVWAHLRKLRQEQRAAADDPDDISATWSAAVAEPRSRRARGAGPRSCGGAGPPTGSPTDR